MKVGWLATLTRIKDRLLLLVGQALLMQLAFGVARAARQFVDHLLRQAGHHALPVVRQDVDIEPLGGGDQIDLHLAGQRDADRAAVGIAPRRADIIRGAGIDAIDRDIHRLLEGDHHDRAGDADLRLDLLVEAEHQPRITAVGGDVEFAFDRLGGIGAAGENQREREQHERSSRTTPPHRRTNDGRRRARSRARTFLKLSGKAVITPIHPATMPAPAA